MSAPPPSPAPGETQESRALGAKPSSRALTALVLSQGASQGADSEHRPVFQKDRRSTRYAQARGLGLGAPNGTLHLGKGTRAEDLVKDEFPSSLLPRPKPTVHQEGPQLDLRNNFLSPTGLLAS